jgi:hypothetical protein
MIGNKQARYARLKVFDAGHRKTCHRIPFEPRQQPEFVESRQSAEMVERGSESAAGQGERRAVAGMLALPEGARVTEVSQFLDPAHVFIRVLARVKVWAE